MSFKPFTEFGAASRSELTIRTNDLLFISKSTLRQFTEGAKFARLHVDDTNSLIGIEFLKEEPAENYRKITEERAGISINIGPVLRYFGIKKLAKKHMVDYEEQEGLLTFSVKELKSKKADSAN